MYSTFHLKSAEDINTDILDAIKAVYKSKAITIIVEEHEGEYDPLSADMKNILDDRLEESKETYLSSEDSVKTLSEKHGL